MTLEEAQRLRVCRICGGGECAGMVYGFGTECAHRTCLDREERTRRRLLWAIWIACAIGAAGLFAAAVYVSQGG